MNRTKTKTDLAVLERLWARDAEPWRVEEHFFLYWWAAHWGDLDKIAEELGVHRNTVEFHFKRFDLLTKADILRQNWGTLAGKERKDILASKFFLFYGIEKSRNQLSERENRDLMALWQLGFPFKTIDAHYMLWALRQGKNKLWVQKKLGYTSHHCMRTLTSLLDPRSENGRWLAPMNPRQEEIYTRMPRERLMKLKPVRTLMGA